MICQASTEIWSPMYRKIIIIIPIMFALFGCVPIERSHGYVPSDEKLAKLEIGQTTKETTAKLIGKPMALGVLDDSQWIYSASRWHTKGYNAPEEKWRKIILLSFDEQDILINIEKLSKKDGRIIILSRDVTDDPVKNLSFFRQLFGNINNVQLDSKDQQ